MKRLPEKMIMACIILSCGFFTHSEPSAGDRGAKQRPVADQHPNHHYQDHDQAAAHPAKHRPAVQIAKEITPPAP